MTHHHYTDAHQVCEDCNRPATRDGYCEDHFWDNFGECDCCGKVFPREHLDHCWHDTVGDTYACHKCQGWAEDEIEREKSQSQPDPDLARDQHINDKIADKIDDYDRDDLGESLD